MVMHVRTWAVLLSVGAHAVLFVLLPEAAPKKEAPITLRWVPATKKPDDAPLEPSVEPATTPEPARPDTIKRRRRPTSTATSRADAPNAVTTEASTPGPSAPIPGGAGARPEEGGVLAPGGSGPIDLSPTPGPPGPEVIARAAITQIPGKVRIPGLSPKAGGGYVYRDRGFDAEIHRDGSVEFDPNKIPVGFFGEDAQGNKAMFSMDITEAVMMIAGDDPYRADKEAFLRMTQGLRLELCAKDHEERLEIALYELSGRLERVWSDGREAEAKRRALFQLWDECMEPDPGSTDLAERTGAQARATILAFIRKNLPSGSLAAYPGHELLALNERRRSRATFDPYGTLTDAGTCD